MVKTLNMNNASYKFIVKALSNEGKLNDMLKVVDEMLDDDGVEFKEDLQEFIKGEILGKEDGEEDLVSLWRRRKGRRPKLRLKKQKIRKQPRRVQVMLYLLRYSIKIVW